MESHGYTNVSMVRVVAKNIGWAIGDTSRDDHATITLQSVLCSCERSMSNNARRWALD